MSSPWYNHECQINTWSLEYTTHTNLSHMMPLWTVALLITHLAFSSMLFTTNVYVPEEVMKKNQCERQLMHISHLKSLMFYLFLYSITHLIYTKVREE